jgi:carbon starvation protein CstA
VLPVWMLLAPRDYLSTFMKIGTIVLLAIGIVVTLPVMQNERVTEFASSGGGPVFAGALFPFVFITIACGALSGFHSLIASGTTPKMIEKESQVRFIGYGAMLMESFVAVMAIIAASIIDRGCTTRRTPPPASWGTACGRPRTRSGSSASRSRRPTCSRRPVTWMSSRSWPAPAARRRSPSASPRSSRASSAAA